MLYIITFSLIILIVINFLLLRFSCNKTNTKTSTNKKPVIFSKKVTNLPASEKLAPTGS